jgi:hypothetical protein
MQLATELSKLNLTVGNAHKAKHARGIQRMRNTQTCKRWTTLAGLMGKDGLVGDGFVACP